ncbi:MAG: pyridoxamine 5'-phosphate oxidase family protein [Halorientalis sp.]
MTMDTTGQWMGTPMNTDEIDGLLVEKGWGIVSLASDDEPYSIPISFGYDGEDIYFVFLEDSPDNRKLDFIDDGKTVRLLVTDVGGRFHWQSIAVTGTARTVEHDTDDWTHLMDTLDDNGWFSSDFERSGSLSDMHGWRLDVDEVRGLEVTES